MKTLFLFIVFCPRLLRKTVYVPYVFGCIIDTWVPGNMGRCICYPPFSLDMTEIFPTTIEGKDWMLLDFSANFYASIPTKEVKLSFVVITALHHGFDLDSACSICNSGHLLFSTVAEVNVTFL